MKNRKNRTGIYLSLALSAVLAAADTLPAAAAEYPYSQYISGENAQNLPESEAGYTIVSLSTEAFSLLRTASWTPGPVTNTSGLKTILPLAKTQMLSSPALAASLKATGTPFPAYRLLPPVPPWGCSAIYRPAALCAASPFPAMSCPRETAAAMESLPESITVKS